MLGTVHLPAIEKRCAVAAPRAEVWRAWTTAEGIREFLAPDARIDLEAGGRYEILFARAAPDGSRGTERCVVLAVEEPHHLRFTWNAPPDLPASRVLHTIVDLYLDEHGADATGVSLYHYGWEPSPPWEEARLYFDAAWDRVLDALADRYGRA